MEIKHLSLSECALKFAPDAPGRFDGYGSVFGVKDAHNDIVMPGAYAGVIKSGKPVHVYVNHGWMRGALPVGRWDGLAEDAMGLKGQAVLQMDMPDALNAYGALRGGLVEGLSVAILLHPDDVERKSDGSRLIHNVRGLKEISIVNTPSNGESRVLSVKGAAAALEAIEAAATIREIEQALRDAAGLSKGAAAALVARVKALVGQGEPAATKADDEDAAHMRQVADRLARMLTAG